MHALGSLVHDLQERAFTFFPPAHSPVFPFHSLTALGGLYNHLNNKELTMTETELKAIARLAQTGGNLVCLSPIA